MHASIKRGLFVSAALACYAATLGATAQDDPKDEKESARTLSTVTVTAQRREENLQDVPLSVTAADAKILSELRVDNIENLSLLTPSISFRKTNIASSSSNIQIRGIGTTGNARVFEGAVGVFIDGVYRSRSGQALSNFLDVETLQVLRGPQGTLFGKNTSAGALLITSVDPSFDKIEGFAEASYGNYNATSLKGAVNLPINDWAALRIAGVHYEEDGFLDNPNGGTLNDVKRDGLRATLALEPSSDLSIRLIADYSKQDDECCYGTVDSFDGPLQGFIDSLTAANGLTPPSHNPSDFEAVTNPATPNKVTDKGLTMLVDYQTDAGTLKSVTAFRQYNVDQVQDADFSGATIMDLDERFKSDFFSQEFTFSGETRGKLNANYVIGMYYSDEDLDMGRDLRHGAQAQLYWDTAFSGVLPAGFVDASPGLFTVENFKGKAESFALFTHWDVELNDKWNLIVGLRYTEDEKTGSFSNPYFRSPLDPLAIAGVMPGLEYEEEFADEAVTGTLSLQYRPNNNAMLYASYNRGYKAGGVNMDVNAAGVPGNFGSPLYNPETIDAFELGAKLDWLDGTARTNIAFFYNDIQDLQVAQFLGLQFAIVNSPSAEVTGAEIEQTYAVNEFLTASASATWLETADFGDDAILGIADPTRPELGGLSGRRFSTAPELAAQASLNMDYPLTSSIYLTGLAQLQYTDDVYTNTASNLTQKAVTLVNANIGLDFDAHNVTVSAFVRNLTDEVYVAQHFNTPLQDIDRNAYMGTPRTYGIMVRKTF